MPRDREPSGYEVMLAERDQRIAELEAALRGIRIQVVPYRTYPDGATRALARDLQIRVDAALAGARKEPT